MPATKRLTWYGVGPEGPSRRVRTSTARESSNPHSPSGEYGGGTAVSYKGNTWDFGSQNRGPIPLAATKIDQFIWN